MESAVKKSLNLLYGAFTAKSVFQLLRPISFSRLTRFLTMLLLPFPPTGGRKLQPAWAADKP